MTVAELIAKLQRVPAGAPIQVASADLFAAELPPRVRREACADVEDVVEDGGTVCLTFQDR